MKKTYERPIVLANQSLAEGVFLASGDSCYSTTAYIHQTPETGRETYKIQFDAHHEADHCSNYNQCLHITFNQPVEYVSSSGTYEGGNGTCTLDIGLSYWNNKSDNIGNGSLEVKAGDSLAITFVWTEDRAKQY